MSPSLINSLKSIISSTALIVNSEADGITNRPAGLSDGDNSGSDGTDPGTRIDQGHEGTVAKTANYSIMDHTQPAMIKDGDYVVDVILPTILIALLFVGNAVIVYIIFQYRKRKTPSEIRGEEIALDASTNGEPQV